MATFEQADWGGGIYRGRKAPPGTVYDALNALVDDEGNLFARGKSAYKSSVNAGATLRNLATAHTRAGARTVFSAGDKFWTLDTNDQTPLLLSEVSGWLDGTRLAAAGGALFMPGSAGWLFVFGGPRTDAFLNAGTASVATGSRTVTGVGTSWSSAEPGMLFGSGHPSSDGIGIVESVNSDTSLTLAHPWGAAPLTGMAYTIAATFVSNPFAFSSYFDGADGSRVYLAAVGTSKRLVVAYKQRAYVSRADDPFTFAADQYLELPSDVEIIGADAFQDTALIFTSRGVWALSNLDFDPVDGAGNVQWQQQEVNRDLVLWGDTGIAAWEGALVVPAVDDVYLFAPSGEARSVSEAIRPLYRSYVKAGYQPGTASVHRGHCFLPVLNGSTLVDVLVCRLDRPSGEAGLRPWTRWTAHAAGVAYAQRVGSTTRSPKLFGVNAERVTDLTGCLDAVSSSQDADGGTPTFWVETNDYDLGPGVRPNTAEKVRAVYETYGGSPVVGLDWARGPVDASWSAGVLKRGGGSSDGTDYSAWRVGKAAERIRFRLMCESQLQSLILRRLEVTIRQAAQN